METTERDAERQAAFNAKRAGQRTFDKHSPSSKVLTAKAWKQGVGDPLDVLKWQNDPSYLDKNDPNYDPDEAADQDEIVFDDFVVSEDDATMWKQHMQDQIKYKINVNKAITQLYEKPDDKETFMKFINKEGNIRGSNGYRHVLVKLLVSSTYGKDETQQALITSVLTDLYKANIVGEEDLDVGFGSLFSTCMEEGQEAINSLDAMVSLGEKAALLSKSTVQRFTSAERVEDVQASEHLASWRENDCVSKLKLLKKSIDECFREYFTSGSYEQCAQTIMELNAPFHYEVVHYEVVKRGISISLDKDNKCRELMSRLLAYYSGSGPSAVLQANAVQRGFELLVQRVDDLYVDVPDVLYLLSCFIARAIVDEVLPPSFVKDCAVQDSDMGTKVLRHVSKVLGQKSSYERLARVWVSGKDKSVPELKTAIKGYIREYFLNGEMDDTIGNLKELGVPYFDHEIVKQIIILTCDYKDRELGCSIELLKLCCSQQLISTKMLQLGFSKVATGKATYIIDIPNLPKVYNALRDAVVGVDPKLQIDPMLNLGVLPGKKIAKISPKNEQSAPAKEPATAKATEEAKPTEEAPSPAKVATDS